MPTVSGGLGVLYLLGAVQGAFLAAVLAGRRENATPNRLLALVMLTFSVDLAMAAYHATGLYTAVPALIGLDFPLAFLYGPLLYLYARTLTEPAHRLRRLDFFHLLPFAVVTLALVPYYAMGGAEKLAMLNAPVGPWSRTLAVVNGLKLVHAFGYIVTVVLVVRRHRRRLRDTHTATERVALDWLRNLTGGVVFLMTLTVGLYAAGVHEAAGVTVMGLDPSQLYDDFTLLALTVFIYAIGYLGLRQPEIFSSRPGVGRPPEPVMLEPVVTAADALEERPRYAKSGMDGATAARLEAALVALMEGAHPYRQGDLTLQELADRLGASPHNLTEVVNTRLGQSFYDFVNGYRVREAQARLTDPAFAHWTVLAIGLEAGFNSKSSFHAAFKRHAGQTPSAYREAHGVTV